MRKIGATIRGFGEYKISNNSILKGGMSPPMITNSVSNGAVIIRHREYLRDINARSAFTNLQFAINPGVQSTFPWLAQIAPSFEQYRFRGLVFEYKTMSADVVLSGASSTALGSIVMGTQYDVLDPPFDNKFEMENWEFTTSCKPSVTCLHPVECAKSQTPVTMLYIRTGPPPANADKRLYDLANFNIAVVGMQNVIDSGTFDAIGELWCSYEIELYKPRLVEDVTSSYAHFSNRTPGTGELAIGNPSQQYAFGSINGQPDGTNFLPLAASNTTLPCYIQVNTATTSSKLVITDSIGKKLWCSIQWWWGSGITALSAFTFPTLTSGMLTNGTLINLTGNGTSGQPNSNYTMAGHDLDTATPTTRKSLVTLSWAMEIKNDYFEMFLGGFTWTGNATSGWDLIITELGPDPQ